MDGRTDATWIAEIKRVLGPAGTLDERLCMLTATSELFPHILKVVGLAGLRSDEGGFKKANLINLCMCERGGARVDVRVSSHSHF